jgi:hypothetical protein
MKTNSRSLISSINQNPLNQNLYTQNTKKKKKIQEEPIKPLQLRKTTQTHNESISH